MLWKECSVLDERIRFVIRYKDGEDMSSLCREYGISRKTGYKIVERDEECGKGKPLFEHGNVLLDQPCVNRKTN